jgi:AsmA protein
VTASTGLKRLVLAVALVVAAGFAVLVAAVVLIPADRVREAVQAEIRAVTGLEPMLRGNVSVSLFPSGAVSFDDVVLGDNRTGQTALSADLLTARLRFFPLLTGRIEIADVTLERPRIAVTFDADGRSNWSPLIATLAQALKPNPGRLSSFAEIRVAGGSVVLRDAQHDLDERIDDVELSLAWPSISKSFAATGRFNWRGEAVNASFSLGDFLAALTGDRASLKLRLAGAPLKVAFDGHMSAKPTLKIEGTLAADAGSLRDALGWTGRRTLPGGGFGRFALKAQTNVVGGNVGLSGVNIELDGNSAEGVLSFSTDGRQLLQGTLAAEALDLSPYLSAVRLQAVNQRDWSRLPIEVVGLLGTDLDLRLSAAKIKVGKINLGRTAVATSLRDGRLNVTIGESQAFGGVITGSVGLADTQSGAEFRSQLQFTEVDLEACLGELFGVRRLEGKGNLAFSIEGSGVTVLALTRTLNGQATLVGRQGAVAGLNVEQLLRRLAARPLSGGGDFRSGRTAYDRLAMVLKIVQGTVNIEDMEIEGPTVRLALTGSASIPQREFDLKGTASLVAIEPGAAAFELPFVVQGPWDDPLLLPDAQVLIRRSGATQPLLDAMRDRRATDAVKKAIDRLVGGRPPAAPAAAEPSPGAD